VRSESPESGVGDFSLYEAGGRWKCHVSAYPHRRHLMHDAGIDVRPSVVVLLVAWPAVPEPGAGRRTRGRNHFYGFIPTARRKTRSPSKNEIDFLIRIALMKSAST